MARNVINKFFIEGTDELLIAAMPPRGWVTDDEWLQYLHACARLIAEEGPFHAWLIWAPGEGPNAKQRKMTAVDEREALKLWEFRRCAVLTDSLLARGVLTALRWLANTDTKTKGFAVNDVSGALIWLREQAKFDVHRAQAVHFALTRLAGDKAI
jgi:hypothetical protein